MTDQKLLSMTETAIRSRLRRRGYRLVRYHDPWGAPGYMVADANTSYVVYGHDTALVSLEDVADWIKWLDSECND